MKHNSKIKVFIADDHPMIIAGVRSSLSECKNIEIVGEASVGTDVIPRLKHCMPDVLLMDLSMPVLSGAQILRRLKHHAPNVKVIAFTVHNEREYMNEIISLGACGYLLKEISPQELIRAIESVYAGNIFFSSCVQKILINQCSTEESGSRSTCLSGLARKEEEVLTLVADGFSNAKIAEKLYIGERTVETYRRRIMDKLNIRSVAGLTKYAIDNGFI